MMLDSDKIYATLFAKRSVEAAKCSYNLLERRQKAIDDAVLHVLRKNNLIDYARNLVRQLRLYPTMTIAQFATLVEIQRTVAAVVRW